jgi:hypothetical protein
MDRNKDFTTVSGNEISENRRDENEILTDQDITHKSHILEDDENLGAKSRSLGALEDESEEFIQGAIDVKKQMDLASEAMDDSIHGVQENVDADDPQGDLDASFRATTIMGEKTAVVRTPVNSHYRNDLITSITQLSETHQRSDPY